MWGCLHWYGPLAVSNHAAIERGEHPLDEYVEKDETKREDVEFSLPMREESAILAEAIEKWIESLEEAPVSVGDKILGLNAWNRQPIHDDVRILGHHPTLEQYDRK